SISGIAICIPACTGFRPGWESRQDSMVCVSRLTADRYGRFKLRRNSEAATLSFIAGPPTKLKPVSETIWLTRDRLSRTDLSLSGSPLRSRRGERGEVVFSLNTTPNPAPLVGRGFARGGTRGAVSFTKSFSHA